ncbi:MAG TPA: relaxase MobL [Blastocatellia bacterium]|nr:relaxase MobL [Blastocatellia bacterium]HMY70270.1 relaxase MobL [Blastocatellia bacterium]HMZ17546.1 relaxase MobL [Blastocatellia bacterium]
MKVIVVIKAGMGGSGASQAARYVATRARDEAREGSASRPLFSERAADLNHTQANHWLGEGRAPSTDDVLHLVISFHREEDFLALGADEENRLEGVRRTTRATMEELAHALNARELRWVAGLHRNTDNPHVHLLIQRYYRERQIGQAKRLKTLPPEWRVHWEKTPDKTRVTHPGLFSQTFEKHLVQHLRQLEQTQHTRNEQELRARIALGQALMATERIQLGQEQLRRMESFGAWRRYRIIDAEGRSHWLSEADVQWRPTTPSTSPHDSIVQKLRAARFAEHSRLESQLDAARLTSQPVLAAAQSIAERYAKDKKPLPVPLLARADLAHLQQRALARNDAEPLRRLEAMRVSLAAEKHEPTRTEAEMARLRAQLFVARSGLTVEEQSAARFAATKHLRQWHASQGEQTIKQSLAQLEAARLYAVDQAKFIGARHLHWDAGQRARAHQQADALLQQRAEVLQQMEAERARLAAEVARRSETIKVLEEIYAEEKSRYEAQGRPLPAPRFTEQEMRELDAHAARRHDANFYRTLHALERDYDRHNQRNEKESVRERFRRASVREIMAELEVHESAERIERFQEKRSQWMVVTHEDAAAGITLARLSDVEPRAPIEHLFQPLLTRTAKYQAVASAVSAWQQRLQEQHEQNQTAHIYLSATARQSADEFRQHYPGQPLPAPHFTARELHQLEMHIQKESDPARREQYAQMYREALPITPLDAAPIIRLDAQETKDWLTAEPANLREHGTSFER